MKGPGTRDHDLHGPRPDDPGRPHLPQPRWRSSGPHSGTGRPPAARRCPVPGASAGAEESPRGGAAPPRALLAAFQINFQKRPPEPQPRAAASLTASLTCRASPPRGRSGTSSAREAEALEAAGSRRRAREGARSPARGPAGTWPRAAAFSGRPPAQSLLEAKGGPALLGDGEAKRRPGSWVRVGPSLPGRIRPPGRRRAGGKLGEGAGARPAEGPPRSRSEPAARPLPGAPHGPGDLPAAKFPPSTRNRLLGARGPAPGSPSHRVRGPNGAAMRKLHSPHPGLGVEATCSVVSTLDLPALQDPSGHPEGPSSSQVGLESRSPTGEACADATGPRRTPGLGSWATQGGLTRTRSLQ